jgi:hypothetical protein
MGRNYYAARFLIDCVFTLKVGTPGLWKEGNLSLARKA